MEREIDAWFACYGERWGYYKEDGIDVRLYVLPNFLYLFCVYEDGIVIDRLRMGQNSMDEMMGKSNEYY